MLHFLYCFDTNYIKQAFTSIFSILENVDKPVSIHIITDIEEGKIKVPSKVKNHVFIRELVFYKISNLELDLYNLEDAHVTKATFYRLYLEDFLHVDEYVTYLDCDVICLKNPLNVLDEVSNELTNSNKIVSFNTEILRGEGYSYFRDLSLMGDNYFNAGVMVFNASKWAKFDVKNKALKLIPKIQEKAIFWDQDILNIIFDKNFLELPDELNSRLREKKSDTIFHHFSGKFKPWSINGVHQAFSENFHNYYKEIYSGSYLINVPNFKNGRKHLYKKIKDKEIKNNMQGYLIIFAALKSIIKKVKKW